MPECTINTVIILLGLLLNLITLIFLIAHTRLRLEARVTTCENYIKLLMDGLRLNPKRRLSNGGEKERLGESSAVNTGYRSDPGAKPEV
jgi:hypothetical protein